MKQMNYSQIEEIVREVLSRLKQKDHTALVVFTGAAIGFNESIDELKKLVQNNWKLRVVLSRSAEHVLTPEIVGNLLGIEEVHLESSNDGLYQLYEGVDAIIVPTLTMNTAAKIALGMADSLTTNMVAHGIMNAIPTYVVKDASDLHHPERIRLGMTNIPKAYTQLFDNHFKQLESYGIHVVEVSQLSKSLLMVSEPNGRSEELAQKSFDIRKKVISEADIVVAGKSGSTLNISKNSIITPLAHEKAKELGVKIVRLGD